MSAASGWLSFGSKGKSETSGEKQPKIEPATPLPLRFGLPDQRREGLCVSLSPNNTYAATTDSFGRVILIDIAQGIATRMWKGYRDATVGWVEVKEEEESHSHMRQCRSAQFLVIYAPRRGILEIWLAGNGPRVAAFNVSKHCQLVSISHGILGLNNVTSKGIRMKAFQVALLDPAGTLKTVQVPFHLALSDRNNKRVRDMHLLKRLKEILRESKEESDSLAAQVQDLLLNIKICSIAQQTTTSNGDDDYDAYGHDDKDSEDKPHEIDGVKAEAGTIAGTVFGVLVATVFLIFVVGMYFKRRRQRMERDIESEVMHKSRMHAGVYMPTTSEPDLQQMPGYTAARGSDISHSGKGQEYKSLPKNPDVFESDSDEELYSRNSR